MEHIVEEINDKSKFSVGFCDKKGKQTLVYVYFTKDDDVKNGRALYKLLAKYAPTMNHPFSVVVILDPHKDKNKLPRYCIKPAYYDDYLDGYNIFKNIQEQILNDIKDNIFIEVDCKFKPKNEWVFKNPYYPNYGCIMMRCENDFFEKFKSKLKMKSNDSNVI